MGVLVSVALYAQSLGKELTKSEQTSAASASTAPPFVRKSREQMSRKPSCKAGSSRWAFDGDCSDPEVFGIMMGLDGPPAFKMMKVPLAEFEEYIGRIRVHARYDDMRITEEHVNVCWMDSGEFKFSGSYGR